MAFLGIKAVEYKSKFDHLTFQYKESASSLVAVRRARA